MGVSETKKKYSWLHSLGLTQRKKKLARSHQNFLSSRTSYLFKLSVNGEKKLGSWSTRFFMFGGLTKWGPTVSTMSNMLTVAFSLFLFFFGAHAGWRNATAVCSSCRNTPTYFSTKRVSRLCLRRLVILSERRSYLSSIPRAWLRAASSTKS